MDVKGEVTTLGMLLAALLGALLGIYTYLSEPETIPIEPQSVQEQK